MKGPDPEFAAARFVLTVHLPEGMSYEDRVRCVKEALARELHRMRGMGRMYQGDSWSHDCSDGSHTVVAVHPEVAA